MPPVDEVWSGASCGVCLSKLGWGQIEMVRLRNEFHSTPYNQDNMVLRSICPTAVFVSVFLLASAYALAQEVPAENSAQRYVCLTLDSKVVRCGYLVSDDGRDVTLNTLDMGTLIVPKVSVLRMTDSPEGTLGNGGGKSIEMSDRMLSNDRALQATRYFFAPSAHSLKKGEGYASVAPYTGANVSYGVSDNFIAGLSASFLGTGFTVKASKELSEGTRASAGALYNIGWGGGQVFFPFANLTWGDENEHITLGGGYLGGNIDGVISGTDDINSPMVNLSGCLQVADNAWLMSENYYFFNPEFFPVEVVLSMGIRIWRPYKQRLFEPAVMYFQEADGTSQPVPWVSWTWPF